MKHLYTVLLFSLISTFGYSQSFSTEVPDTTLYGLASQSTFYGDIDLTNLSTVSLPMFWSRFEENMPAGWEASNCDPTQCHPIGTYSGNFSLPTSGNNNILNTHFYPNGVSGSGYVRVALYDQSNMNDSVVLTYYGVAGVVGISELDDKDVLVFPVPATSVVNVMVPHTNAQLTAEMYDLTGGLVKRQRIVAGSRTEIGIDDLQSGIYLLRIEAEGHGVVVTRRVIKR